MTEFSRYFVKYLRMLFENIGDFFSRVWEIISHVFYYDIKEYFDIDLTTKRCLLAFSIS